MPPLSRSEKPSPTKTPPSPPMQSKAIAINNNPGSEGLELEEDGRERETLIDPRPRRVF
ncbi:hypothetical protein Acr_02g0000070 [Actinidia rufa]|uniref:Uncharacterized protein n=1 Tax=Actinidia rufa TaxID=165716 RepID=A0A7J0E7W7_9ERIC|nr:hypothetical protein Acr_02g0000070 [Actinidia rufa]